MPLLIRSACCCSRGKIRARNEDNFYFDGAFLPEENNGLEKTLVLNGFLGKDRVLAVFVAAMACPLVNTGIFLLGCWIFFFDTVAAWGAALGFENAAAYMFLGLAGTNFLIEMAVNIVLAPMIVRLIKIKNH